jgi:DNA-directed RNA polymerase subunit alpha
MEIGIERGVGYVPADGDPHGAFGEILIDAQFSPVIKANYEVENISMGSDMKFERLVMKVQTNGSLSPSEAIEKAGEILLGHIARFVKKDPADCVVETKQMAPIEASEKVHPILYHKVRDFHLELPRRCLTCLEKMGIHFIGALIQKTELQLRKTPHLGEKSLGEIKEFLSAHNLTLGMEVPGWSVEDDTPRIESNE